MDKKPPTLLVAAFSFVIGFIAFGLLSSPTYEEFMFKAVERNAAEWIIDTKTGKTTFTWKEIKP